jgi:hypothetical protein
MSILLLNIRKPEVDLMKWIKYKGAGFTQVAAEDGTVVDKEIVYDAKREYSVENLEYVKTIAVNGEYTIEDDENVQPTLEERTAALEAAMLEMLGVNLNG